jgi:hypothetical protein
MTIPRPTRAAVSLALAALIACSACGSSGPPPLSLRQKVSNVFTATDAALARDRNKYVANPPLVYQKFSVDFMNSADAFHKLTFPHRMQHDADTLVADLNVLAADASILSKAQALSQSVLANVQAEGQATLKLNEAEETEKKASDALRRDVGLPKVVTATTTTSPALKLTTTTTAPTTTTTKG